MANKCHPARAARIGLRSPASTKLQSAPRTGTLPWSWILSEERDSRSFAWRDRLPDGGSRKLAVDVRNEAGQSLFNVCSNIESPPLPEPCLASPGTPSRLAAQSLAHHSGDRCYHVASLKV